MLAIGAFAAKAQFSALLERVARGEEVVITKHGRPVAKLVPAQTHDRERVAEAIRRLKQLRSGTTLGGISWRELRDEGRRCVAWSSIARSPSPGASRTRQGRTLTPSSIG